MYRYNKSQYQMFTRLVSFGSTRLDLFPKSSAAAELFETLEADVKKLSDISSAKVSADNAMHICSNARGAAREKLKDALSRAYRIAVAINSDKVRLPAKNTDQALIDSGRAFALDAGSLKKAFVEHGLVPGFTEEVKTTVEELEHAILDYNAAKATRSSAVEEWRSVVDETYATVLRLDALVANVLEGNAGAFAAYATARAVASPSGRRTAKASADPPAAAEAEAASPAA